jgi:hypothetical protein
MRILLYPIGGLANRMRAIDSAVNFSEYHKCRLDVFWVRDKGLNCEFKAIWKPIPFLHDVNGQISGLFFYMYRRLSVLKYLFEILAKLRILKIFVDQYAGKDEEIVHFARSENNKQRFMLLVIKTCEDFYPGKKFRDVLFQLRPEIEELVKKETVQFDKNTLGVHIRKTDHVDSIKNSPLELFEARMTKEVEIYPETRFYIASDEEAIKDHFIQSPIWKDKVIMSKGILARDTQEGIIQSVIEFYCLSLTQKIFGSYRSSFSLIAAKYGESTLEVVHIQPFSNTFQNK